MALSWEVPFVHFGKTVAVLASGPSMNSWVAEKTKCLPTIAVNSTFRLAPWAWALYGADTEWWAHPENKDAHQFKGLKVSCLEAPGTLRIRYGGKFGYSDSRDIVYGYGNSGAQAVQIAEKSGAQRVLLCGFDMRAGHWHGDHPQGLRQTPPEQYAVWRENFAKLGVELEKRGVEVVNCTPGSALECFRFGDLEEEIALSVSAQ